MSNPKNKRLHLFAGIIIGMVILVTAGYLLFNLLLGNKGENSQKDCLETGRYILREVYLDSMLYLNGNEQERLARYDVTRLFTGGQTISMDFSGEISLNIYNGEARINYPNGYGLHYKVSSITSNRSKCHGGMVLSEGKTMQNGTVLSDTVRNANHISTRNRLISDFEGTYRLNHDTLRCNYTPSADWQWKMPFDTLNPFAKAFVNYRGGNKVFRFVWVKVK
jgi:hypothetical protein